jgi:hypothetical protein
MAMDPTTGGCPETDFFVGHIDALFPITHHLSCGDSHAALMGVGWAWASQVDNRCNGNGPRHRFGLAKNVVANRYSDRVVVGAKWSDPP